MVLKATLQKESPNQSLPKVSSEPGEVYQNKNRFFRNFPIFTGKTSVFESLFNKAAGRKTSLYLKETSTHVFSKAI